MPASSSFAGMTSRLRRWSRRLLLLLALPVALLAGSQTPVTNSNWQEHEIATPHLGAPGYITVRVPSDLRSGGETRYPVLYLLPVGTRRDEPAKALRELEQTPAVERFIVVMPWFDTTPWYANHRDDTQRQHERHLLEVVIPFVDATYPTVASAEGRSLIGFSKSGWGAFSLIFRHPDLFGFAASWDAPLALRDEDYGIWGTAKQTGSLEQFRSFHPWWLMELHAQPFRERPPRLILAGSALFGPGPQERYRDAHHTEAAHARLRSLQIPHRFLPHLHRPHAWTGGWLGVVAEALSEMQSR